MRISVPPQTWDIMHDKMNVQYPMVARGKPDLVSIAISSDLIPPSRNSNFPLNFNSDLKMSHSTLDRNK